MTYRAEIRAGRREPLFGRASLGFVSFVSCKTHLAHLCQERPPDGGHRLRQQTSGGDPSFSGGYHRLFPQKEMGVHIPLNAGDGAAYGPGVSFPTSRQNASSVFALRQSHRPLAVPKNFGGMRLERGKEPLASSGSHFGITPHACRTLRS